MRGNVGNGLTRDERRAIGLRILESAGEESLCQLARRIGVHESMVCNWQSGVALPTLGNWRKLSLATGRSVDWFLGIKHDDRLVVKTEGVVT